MMADPDGGLVLTGSGSSRSPFVIGLDPAADEATNVVRVIPQIFSDAQETQARNNIYAVGKGDEQINVKDTPYGALGNGVTNDSTAIQGAITAASAKGGGIVFFPAGTYKLGTYVTLPSNVELVGAPGAIIDASTTTAVGSARYGIRAAGTLGTARSLGVNAVKGQYTLTLGTGLGVNFAVGDWIRLSSGARYPWDGGTDYTKGEIKRIRLVTGDVLTFEQALEDSYLVADTAVAAKITFVENVRVHGLNFKGANVAGDGGRTLVMEYVNGFIVTDNSFNDCDTYAFHLRNSIRGEVTGNRFRGVFYDGVTGSIFYAVVMMSACQWIRVHHNHGERVRHLVTITAASNDPGCPRHILVDGNIAQNMEAGAGGRSWAYEHHGVGEDIVFADNIADGCYGGICVRGPGVTIRGNTVRNWYAYGIHVHNIYDARDITIDANTVQARSLDGGAGLVTAAAVFLDFTNAVAIGTIVVSNNVLNLDLPGRPVVDCIAGSVAATAVVVKDNILANPGATVDGINLPVRGGLRHGNIINTVPEGYDTMQQARSSLVSTMPRQVVGSSVGTITTGWEIAARAKCLRGGTFTKIRFCTGTTAPVLTDFRGGVWNSADAVLAETANSAAIVIAASTVYELTLITPVTLVANQDVYLGFGVLGATTGTYRGNASFSAINQLDPPIARLRTGWTTGALAALNTASSSIPWVELVP